MLDALEPLGRDVCLDFCRPPTLARMEQMLSEAQERGEPYYVLHFDGHGMCLLAGARLEPEQEEPTVASDSPASRSLRGRIPDAGRRGQPTGCRHRPPQLARSTCRESKND